MLYHLEKDLSSDYHRPNQGQNTKHTTHSELFVSSLKEIYQKTNKVLKQCEPYSLMYKELEDVLLLIETKQNYFIKLSEGVTQPHEKPVQLKDFLQNHHPTQAFVNSLDDSITEDNSVQNFRKQGRELINEYKTVLGEMKNRNQVLKSLYQPPDSITSPHSVPSNPWKPSFLSPTNHPIAQTNFAVSPIGLFSSPVNHVPTVKFNRESSVAREPQKAKEQTPTYNEVLVNIEKFMRNLDQRTAGQSKRIESITQEIDLLKQQMQPYKHISEIRDIADKLDAQRELLQEKFTKENPAKQEAITARIQEKRYNAIDIAEQINHKAAQLDGIHDTFEECSKLLVRKRLEHTYARETGQLGYKSPEPERAITPIYHERPKERQSQERLPQEKPQERQPQERPSQIISSNPNDFDVQAALLRRELRNKNFIEREERIRRGETAAEGETRTNEAPLSSSVPEDFSMNQTLRRSDNQNRFNENEGVEVRVQYGSKLNSVAKIEEELASTKKSCLSRRAFSSKENSGSKQERRIRFADEEIGKRALKFDEIEVTKPLGDQDLNTNYVPRYPAQKSMLKGEISQLDKEIKIISQLLNSALLSETISVETKI